MDQDRLRQICDTSTTMLQNVPADMVAEQVWLIGVTLDVWRLVHNEHPCQETLEMVELAQGVYDIGCEWLDEFYESVEAATRQGNG